jgi:hypothetical protein
MDITEQIHRYECEECGTANSCATDAEGRRLCATDAAELQKHGARFIEWDDDAPQSASMTAAGCGHCGEEVEFVDGDEAWQLKGKTAPGWDTRPFTCLSSPDHRHDPAHLAEVRTVTVTYARKRWSLEFSKLPGQKFGPYDLAEAAGQLRVAALLEPLAVRELLLDAAEAEDRTATAAVG